MNKTTTKRRATNEMVQRVGHQRSKERQMDGNRAAFCACNAPLHYAELMINSSIGTCFTLKASPSGDCNRNCNQRHSTADERLSNYSIDSNFL